MNEQDAKRKIITFLRAQGFRAYRIENKLEHGMPDILIDRGESQLVWMEVKMGKEPLNRNQEIWICREAEAGAIILLARLRDGGMELARLVPGDKKKPEEIPSNPTPGGQLIQWPPTILTRSMIARINLFLDRLE